MSRLPVFAAVVFAILIVRLELREAFDALAIERDALHAAPIDLALSEKLFEDCAGRAVDALIDDDLDDRSFQGVRYPEYRRSGLELIRERRIRLALTEITAAAAEGVDASKVGRLIGAGG